MSALTSEMGASLTSKTISNEEAENRKHELVGVAKYRRAYESMSPSVFDSILI